MRAWAALPEFRGEARFSTWLHRIVARCALDRAEVLRRRRGREQELTDAVADLAATASPDPAARIRLEALVMRLSEAQRVVVTLFYLEDRSVEQVADSLGMPTGTVKTHLSRARAALRDAWLAEEKRCPR